MYIVIIWREHKCLFMVCLKVSVSFFNLYDKFWEGYTIITGNNRIPWAYQKPFHSLWIHVYSRILVALIFKMIMNSNSSLINYILWYIYEQIEVIFLLYIKWVCVIYTDYDRLAADREGETKTIQETGDINDLQNYGSCCLGVSWYLWQHDEDPVTLMNCMNSLKFF